MQREKTTLKQAAEKLNINYSSAKTIVQTFRKEKRIKKKPKHVIKTKKSIKHEEFLHKVLNTIKMKKVITKILTSEFARGRKHKSLKEKYPNFTELISQARTLSATAFAPENNKLKSFPRIESAGQMQLFEAEKEGPKPGQITRGISASIPPFSKRNIFYVQPEQNFEEDFKPQISHFSPILFQSQSNACRDLDSKISLPPLMDGSKESSKISIYSTVKRQYDEDDGVNLAFDFSQYGMMIVNNAYKGSKSHDSIF